ATERRRMPWMVVEKKYEFAGPNGKGKVSLLDLFEGRRQLIVYRAFFEPRGVRLARARLPRVLPGRRSGRSPSPSERPRHHARVRLTRAAGGRRAPEGADGLGDAHGTPSQTTSTKTSASMNGTATTCSSAMASGCSAHTSSTTAAMRRWGPRGAASTSRRSAVRKL